MAFRFHSRQASETAAHLRLIVPDSVFVRRETAMVKTACPVAVLVAEVRSLPGIHLSCFPVFDLSRSRIGSVIADLVFAAGLFAAGSGSIAAAAVVVVAVLHFSVLLHADKECWRGCSKFCSVRSCPWRAALG